MGSLIDEQTGRRIPLPPRALVGRTRSADVVLEGRWVSAEHAVIWWSPQGWRVKDLGSRNGTAVDGRRVVPPESHPLVAGARVAFGQADACWRVEADDPPSAQARSFEGLIREAVDEVLVLPDECHAWAVIAQEGGEWIIDDRHGRRRILDRDLVKVGDQTWTLRLPSLAVPTGEAPSAALVWDDATLTLAVSRDQETIVARLVFSDGATRMLEARAHHEVLLRLVERTNEDRDNGLSESEVGWLDAELLAQALMTTRDHLNVHVSRLRKQITQAGIADGHEAIERRAGALRVRPVSIEISYG